MNCQPLTQVTFGIYRSIVQLCAKSVISRLLKSFSTRAAIETSLMQLKAERKTIGFVATMGALHAGHLSLIEQAKQQNDVIICSVFVNPTQFNDAKDLEKYPRTIEADTLLLQQAGCDILFNPEVSEMYDADEHWHLAIGELETLLEGKFRPGHYQGVTQVVFKLFNIIKPDNAYFGQKDYQQYLVITKMVELLRIPVNLIMCAIKREDDGLAMSSRNVHLTTADRQHALILSKTLNWVKSHISDTPVSDLQQQAISLISEEPGLELEYFEIADGKTLHPATENSETMVALVAAKVGNTRLIDNMILADGS